MTSRRQSPSRTGCKFKSLTNTSRATAAPASLHTRAAKGPASTLPRSGRGPSTLAVPWRGSDNSDAAKDLAAAKFFFLPKLV